MVITTKYELSQTLYFLKDNRVYYDTVQSINIRHSFDVTRIEYRFDQTLVIEESLLFPSSEELLKEVQKIGATRNVSDLPF